MAHDDLTEAAPLIVHPRTGEVLDPRELSTDALLEARDVIVDEIQERASFRRQIDDELVARMDHEGRRSITFEDFKVDVTPPTEKDWDVEQLVITLENLVERGLISQVKRERCIKVTEEPVWRELKTLLSDPRVSDHIAQCFEEVAARRYLKVSRR